MSQGTTGGTAATVRTSGAARKRAALEMIARHDGALRAMAQRYSIDPDDAEDAYQRALEIALTKAPTTELGELLRWTKTVAKHEALALRSSRERLLGRRHGVGREVQEPLAAVPSRTESPDEQAERREEVAKSREALQALKPDELRALGLLAEGYSYAEIGRITGFSQTKVNRALAEGRVRFRGVVARSEEGRRCHDLQPLLSAFCDGEVSAGEAATVREHLRACAGCRATMRTYRAAPRIAASLLPLLPPSRSLLSRAHELFANLASRLPGVGGDASATQVMAAGGSRGLGTAALAKLLAVCAGAAGGAAACVVTGVVPAPVLVSGPEKPAIERPAPKDEATPEAPVVIYDPLPTEPAPTPEDEKAATQGESKAEASVGADAGATSAGAIEYEPPPAPAEPAPSPSTPGPDSSPAGEFGP